MCVSDDKTLTMLVTTAGHVVAYGDAYIQPILDAISNQLFHRRANFCLTSNSVHAHSELQQSNVLVHMRHVQQASVLTR
jgi:hypothetical protein